MFSIICLVICLSLLKVNVQAFELQYGSSEESSDSSETGGRIEWNRRDKFKCPSLFGAFSDIEDCSSYYVCVGGKSSHKKCGRAKHFDKYRKICLPFIIAVCDDGKGDKTTKGTTPKDGKSTTFKENKFSCPSFVGNYSYPEDCSMYYKCTLFVPSLKTCPQNQLFDGVKKECKPEKDVHCGTRKRPTSGTTAETTPLTSQSTTTEEPTTTLKTTTTEEPTTTLKTTTVEEPTTTLQPTTTEEPTTTLKPTTTETPTSEEDSTTISTATPKPTGPPETDCDEDDLDCIITETGEIPDWFECPVEIGSYRHPSSNKLFIFCINWRPFVKKCGQNLLYSEKMRTCVSP